MSGPTGSSSRHFFNCSLIFSTLNALCLLQCLCWYITTMVWTPVWQIVIYVISVIIFKVSRFSKCKRKACSCLMSTFLLRIVSMIFQSITTGWTYCCRRSCITRMESCSVYWNSVGFCTVAHAGLHVLTGYCDEWRDLFLCSVIFAVF